MVSASDQWFCDLVPTGGEPQHRFTFRCIDGTHAWQAWWMVCAWMYTNRPFADLSLDVLPIGDKSYFSTYVHTYSPRSPALLSTKVPITLSTMPIMRIIKPLRTYQVHRTGLRGRGLLMGGPGMSQLRRPLPVDPYPRQCETLSTGVLQLRCYLHGLFCFDTVDNIGRSEYATPGPLTSKQLSCLL